MRFLGKVGVVLAALGALVSLAVHFRTDSDLSLVLTGFFGGVFLVGGNWAYGFPFTRRRRKGDQ